ncbi:aldose epimerase family protein [Aestuariivirga litoralis]|uniref:aldose epimerase family protein n=1 Tax=Aestuariivirga litoralis TaxID=2650924 RepID=UPI0018C5B1F5|nr:aldose epimerase family protein [Aestuariivirga litoralis]MBG1233616.1 galactose mutarotase [Aestuariivirga litoralis]
MFKSIKSPGLKATFADHGARLVALEIDGRDVVFGTPLDPDFSKWDNSAGVTCGRHAGRISKGGYDLDGERVNLVNNKDGFQLHGGPKGFGSCDWAVTKKGSELHYTLTSPDGDQGFPGELKASAVYGLTGNTLWAELTATTTKPTVINLTNHAYWNLMGPSAGKDDAFTQEIQMHASHYLPVDKNLLPLGDIADVTGTKYDFRKLRAVGQPYDDCFVMDGKRGELKQVLTMRDPKSNRRMEVWNTESAIQFYTALHWSDKIPGKGQTLQQHQAIAIEPQNVPDAPNNPNFPQSVLRPGRTYRNRIEWRFS